MPPSGGNPTCRPFAGYLNTVKTKTSPKNCRTRTEEVTSGKEKISAIELNFVIEIMTKNNNEFFEIFKVDWKRPVFLHRKNGSPHF